MVTGPGRRAGAAPLPFPTPLSVLALLAVVSFLLSGCGLPERGTPPGSLRAAGIDLTGQTYTVGGKEFGEQLVLCKMQIAALESTGATVRDRCGIHGTEPTRAALLTGQIDMYWSYTGTGWITDLAQRHPVDDPRAQYEAVRDRDLATHRVVWGRPTPFDDTYAVATTPDTAARHHLSTTSDWAALLSRGDPDATTCIEPEFAGRPDGWRNLLRTYGVTRAPTGPPGLSTVDADVVYPAVHRGSPCRFGEVFTTDGRVDSLGLVALTDDRHAFPTYNAANTVRRDVVDRAPAVLRVSDEIAPRLDQATMRELNQQVSVAGRDPDTVARDWLRGQGFIGS